MTERSDNKKGGLGVAKIVFFVIAAAAPLTGTLGAVPLSIGLGNGAGSAGAFVVAGLLLGLFSVGYTRLASHIAGAGAFYSYIAGGLGIAAGAGSALVAVVSYTAIQLGLYGLFGFFCESLLQSTGIALPWWIFALAAAAMTHWLGRHRIEVNALILGILMSLEIAIVLLVVAAIVWHAPAASLTWAPFNPALVLSPGFGISMMFALACFVGFEATAIYASEARQPERTVPIATYLSVTVITTFFALATWAISCAYGIDEVKAAAIVHADTMWFVMAEVHLGSAASATMKVLLLSSIFASILAFHNTITRYLSALANDGLVWNALANGGSEAPPPSASLVQTLSIVLSLVVCLVIRADPYLDVFAWMGAFATLGILLLQILTCLSVIVYFSRIRTAEPTWAVRFAPATALVGLCVLMSVMVRNLPLLAGVPDSRLYCLPAIQVVLLLIGAGIIRAKAPTSKTPAVLTSPANWAEPEFTKFSTNATAMHSFGPQGSAAERRGDDNDD